MKRLIATVLMVVGLAFTVAGCGNSQINARIDIASSVNFRCEVDSTSGDGAYTLAKGSSVELFEKCFEHKKDAQRLKGNQVAVSTDYIMLHFVGDAVDNAPVKDGKADYSGFVIFSNNVVRFEYDGASEYYQFNGFYNFVNTYLLIFAEKA